MSLSVPLTTLKGVGPRLADRLERLGLLTVEDLLFHLPYKYQDRTRLVPIGSLRPGEEVVIEGEIEASDIKYGKRRSLLCRISDGTGSLLLRFFHFSAKQQAALQRGVRVRCYGEVRRGPAMLEMVHPEYRQISEPGAVAVEEHLTPVYPVTEGLAQRSLRQLTEQALTLLRQGEVQDYLPPELLNKQRWPTLQLALLEMHQPSPDTPVVELLNGNHPAQRCAISCKASCTTAFAWTSRQVSSDT